MLKFIRFAENMKQFCEWALENDLLWKMENCHVCGARINLVFGKSPKKSARRERNISTIKESAKWICSKNKAHSRTVFYNSIFYKSKLPFDHLLILMYGFAYDFTYADIQRETLSDSEMSSSTISYYYKSFRELLYAVVENIKNENGLLGEKKGSIVEVDESLIGSRKYNRGRYKNGHWIIGMIERQTNNVRFEKIVTRDRDTLLCVLKKYVHKNATIITDCWKGYTDVKSYFHKHITVNHSENFISPSTGAHTQRIECQWRLVKRRIRSKHGGSNSDNLTLHLCEYIYRHHRRDDDKNLFGFLFIQDICKIFKDFSSC